MGRRWALEFCQYALCLCRHLARAMLCVGRGHGRFRESRSPPLAGGKRGESLRGRNYFFPVNSGFNTSVNLSTRPTLGARLHESAAGREKSGGSRWRDLCRLSIARRRVIMSQRARCMCGTRMLGVMAAFPAKCNHLAGKMCSVALKTLPATINEVGLA